MIPRDELIRRLDTYLEIADVADWCPNGLQVEGAAEVHRVVTGVTASEALIQAAVQVNAQMIVVHHGIFWNHQSPVLRGSLLKRVRALLDARITLLAYHLPLDRHPETGNNAPALREMGVRDLEPFAACKGTRIGWKGRFTQPVAPEELLRIVQRVYGVKPAAAFLHGPPGIRSVGLVSGAAQGELATAVAERLDAFITGEVSEYNFHLAKEEGIHFLALGHHASERMGPTCLAAWLARTLPIQAEFIDIPNPV